MMFRAPFGHNGLGGPTLGRFALLACVGALAFTVLARWARPGVLNPAPPERHPDDYLPSESPASTIAIPVGLPLSILEELLEDAVPRSFGSPDALHRLPDRGRTSVEIALQRGPFRASLVDDVARIEATLTYGLNVSYDLPGLPDPGGSCGFDGDPPRLTVVIRSPVSLDQRWALRTSAELVELRPTTGEDEDRCRVTILGLDVTDDVVAGAREFVSSHLAEVDRRAARLDLRSRFEEWWSILQRPIELDDSLWLVMGPERIRRGPVRGTGDSLHVSLAVRARPRILFGRSPRLIPASLPELESGLIEPELDLRVDGRAEYVFGSQFLVGRLGGRRLQLGGRTLTVDSLRVYGVGEGRLALEVLVSGDVSGRIYLTGRPVIDASTGRISVPDLEFDVATDEAIDGIIPRLAARSLRDFLRQEASWPVDPAVRWLADWLRVGLNRKISEDLQVTGVVDTVGIVGIYALQESLLVRLSASGAASLFVLE
jgi:hypothetical protein